MGKEFVETLKIHKSKKTNRNKKWFAGLGSVGHGIFFRQ